MIPEGLSIEMNWDSWQRPAIFDLIQETGNVGEEDMRQTFNLGIGLIAVVDPDSLNDVKKISDKLGEEIFEIGSVK